MTKYYYMKIVTYFPKEKKEKESDSEIKNNCNIMCEEIKIIKKNDVVMYPNIYTSLYDITLIYNIKEYDGPSRTFYDTDGNIVLKEWTDEDGEFHREGKPAIIEFIQGKPRFKEFWEHGKKKIRIEVNG